MKKWIVALIIIAAVVAIVLFVRHRNKKNGKAPANGTTPTDQPTAETPTEEPATQLLDPAGQPVSEAPKSDV